MPSAIEELLNPEERAWLQDDLTEMARRRVRALGAFRHHGVP